MPESLKGLSSDQVVLVTAGANGIGRCFAEAFLHHGCRVHICDISAPSVERFLADNPGATATVADVSAPSDVDRVFKDLVHHHNRLDILVNNAGIAGPTAAVEDIEIADWDKTVAVDLSAHFYVTRLAVPMLKASGGGSIVNNSSSAAFFGYPLRSPYTASKWGLIGLTKTWAMELGPHKIRVNALCPGSVKGKRIDDVIERDAQVRGVDPATVRQVYLEQTSLEVFVAAEDVANMALFLCSDLGANISGQVIGIDGHTESLSHKH
jgi:NAD(P)-dependent dehydrogenase (short-subunit alcohol dehydrogenase family)